MAECRRALWLLGVAPPLDHRGVLLAWRRRVAQTHPDRHLGDAAREAAAAARDRLGAGWVWAHAGLCWLTLAGRQPDREGGGQAGGPLLPHTLVYGLRCLRRAIAFLTTRGPLEKSRPVPLKVMPPG